MFSLLVFYVCAIELYIVIDARHHSRPLYYSKESIMDSKGNYISFEDNNRIEKFTQSDSGRIGRSRIDTMDKGTDADSNKEYGLERDNYSKCAKSRRRTCKILRHKILKDNELEKALRQRDMVRSWGDQLRAVEKFLGSMKEAQRKRKRKSDFDLLLEEIEMKRTRKTTVPVTTADPLQIEGFSNLLGVVDETAVRTALKRDPLVNRILNMGRRKREKFVKDSAKYNITIPKVKFLSMS